MVQTNWIVITGGPCSGISTIINSLEAHGYTVKEEVARKLLVKAMREGKDIGKYRRSNEFEFHIFEQKLENESRLNHNKVFFFDRGLPDSAAYFKLAGIRTDSVHYMANVRRYRKVFWLAPLDWKKDGIRQEDAEEAKKISDEIYHAYLQAGYSPDTELIIVPKMSVSERMNFILGRI